jgi:hypothetical protein
LEDSLVVLRQGRPVHVRFETTFLINWPEHLGGGSIDIDVSGAMVLAPLLGT